MKKLAVIGSADLGQLIAHHALHDGHFEVAGFFDDFRPKGTQTPHGPLLGPINEVEIEFKRGSFDVFMVGIGYRHFPHRRTTFDALAERIPPATIIHSSCYVDKSAVIEPGAFLLPGCVLDCRVRLGRNVLLNTGCVIAHDSRIGAHSFLGPGVTVAGCTEIGSECFLGVGSTLIDNITICAEVQTGGGAVVTENILTGGVYLGIPARRVERR